MSRRILAAQVHEAYEVTGRKPIRGAWQNGNRCCPQFAMALHRGADNCAAWADRTYGGKYAEGFRAGFDGGTKTKNKKDRWYLGFLDGRRIARALGYTLKPFKVAS